MHGLCAKSWMVYEVLLAKKPCTAHCEIVASMHACTGPVTAHVNIRCTPATVVAELYSAYIILLGGHSRNKAMGAARIGPADMLHTHM